MFYRNHNNSRLIQFYRTNNTQLISRHVPTLAFHVMMTDQHDIDISINQHANLRTKMVDLPSPSNLPKTINPTGQLSFPRGLQLASLALSVMVNQAAPGQTGIFWESASKYCGISDNQLSAHAYFDIPRTNMAPFQVRHAILKSICLYIWQKSSTF